MANELQCRTGVSGQYPYALVESMTGTIWSTTGSAFVTYATSDIANYDVLLTERGSTGRYYGTFPTGITTPGRYRARYFVAVSSGSPSESDVFVDEQMIDWDGSAVVGASDVNIARVNDVVVNGVGTEQNPWSP